MRLEKSLNWNKNPFFRTSAVIFKQLRRQNLIRTSNNNMQFFKFIIALVMAGGLTWLMATPNPLGTESVPPIGNVINPFTGFWQNAPAVQIDPTTLERLPGLNYPANIVYDERMVPHIFAENMQDAMYLQGYITAQNRLWQMDITSRFTAGRISEVLGPERINIDKLQRRRGFPNAAKALVEAWKTCEPEYSYVESFAAGANAYIEQLKPADYPLEFKLLNYAPEPWSAYKSALIVKSMDQSLSMRSEDVKASNALAAFGEDTFKFLYPSINPKTVPIIPPGTAWAPTDSTAFNIPSDVPQNYEGFIPYSPMKNPSKHLGSNNWAVAGAKTANGHAIVANDPHLITRLPAIWYEQQIIAGEQMNAYGVTVPGIPGILIGFNNDIAWGETNVSWDLVEWYSIDWVDSGKTKYRIDGQEKAVELQIDTIYVKGQDFVTDTIRLTDFGPIVYTEKEESHVDLAMHWLVHEKPISGGLRTFFKLGQAKNFDDYYEATGDFETPPQNFVFGSREGDIAITVNGRFPIKSEGQGRFVQKGNSTDNLWNGFVTVEQRPRVKNPAQGYVTSANQRSTDETYPFHYHGHFDDFRGRIANRLLQRMDSITIEDMMAMQNSNYSIMAEEALPLMLAKVDTSQLNAIQLGLVKLLRDWKYQFNKELSAPILFEEWWQAFYDLLWDEMEIQAANGPILMPEIWRTIDFLENEPLNVFWDIQATPDRETPEMVITKAFKEMFEKVKPLLDEVDYNWGKHWTHEIPHMANIPAFSRMNVEVGGYGEALNAIKKASGPSWRMIVELGPEVRAYGIYPGGQSGNPGSPFYDQMISDWAIGNYYELFYMKTLEDKRQPIIQNARFERKN